MSLKYLDSIIRNSVCTPAKLPCRRVVEVNIAIFTQMIIIIIKINIANFTLKKLLDLHIITIEIFLLLLGIY
jgi:hypothetical protein